MAKIRLNKEGIKAALLKHYSAPPERIFRTFRSGLIYFSVGLATIIMAQQYMEPSLEQEWITLFGLMLLALGFIIAMLAQVRSIISRFVRFFRK